eukprot:6174002-Pleurochrysis_carterae.AAC.1
MRILESGYSFTVQLPWDTHRRARSPPTATATSSATAAARATASVHPQLQPHPQPHPHLHPPLSSARPQLAAPAPHSERQEATQS